MTMPTATRGRPRSNSPAREQLNIRLRAGEKAKLQRAADVAQRTISDWARLILLDVARKVPRR